MTRYERRHDTTNQIRAFKPQAIVKNGTKNDNRRSHPLTHSLSLSLFTHTTPHIVSILLICTTIAYPACPTPDHSASLPSHPDTFHLVSSLLSSLPLPHRPQRDVQAANRFPPLLWYEVVPDDVASGPTVRRWHAPLVHRGREVGRQGQGWR